MAPIVKTIEEVIDNLTAIVDHSLETKDRIGYFAALYRQVTLAVQQNIADKKFDDGDRMSRFDAAFGTRYCVAVDRWQKSGEPSHCWKTAFELLGSKDTVIVQHLMLGINAHINLDLAIAAVEVAPGESIMALKDDFFLINDILVSVLAKVQGAVDTVSPFMRMLDFLGGRSDEHLLDFNIRTARLHAWENALVLAKQPPEEQQLTVDRLDSVATLMANLVAKPRFPFQIAVKTIARTEQRDVPTVIERLNHALDGE
jgi:hypothetical protein